MIQIYKPNPRNTGLAISFQASDRDAFLYLNMIRQFSWNPATNKGSFIENRDKPGQSTVLKFNQVEAGHWLDAIEQSGTFSGFHGTEKRKTQFSFSIAPPTQEGQAPTAFLLKVNQTNTEDTTQKFAFFIPLSFGEVRLIKEYLIHYLHKSFGLRKQKKPQDPPIDDAPIDLTEPPITNMTGEASVVTEEGNTGTQTGNTADW